MKILILFAFISSLPLFRPEEATRFKNMLKEDLPELHNLSPNLSLNDWIPDLSVESSEIESKSRQQGLLESPKDQSKFPKVQPADIFQSTFKRKKSSDYLPRPEWNWVPVLPAPEPSTKTDLTEGIERQLGNSEREPKNNALKVEDPNPNSGRRTRLKTGAVRRRNWAEFLAEDGIEK